ncbi:MAG TPA: hypothetical protein VN894_10755, partial [Polyangiaceae bacterium]|nr:hypothetical protein [Polyangiaceae bacterium]
QLRGPAAGTAAAGPAALGAAGAEVAPLRGDGGSTLRTMSWIATGALAAGAVTFGALAVGESHALGTERNAFPAMSGVLNHDANLTATYSILADTFAAAAIVVGAASLYWTLSPGVDHAAAPSPQARVTLAPTSARLEMTF